MMFWKWWFASAETPREKGIWGLKAEIMSLNASLTYQADLAKWFRDRVHELEQQLTHKTEISDAHKAAYERERARVVALEKQVEKLTIQLTEETVSHTETIQNFIAGRDELFNDYDRLLQKMADVLLDEFEDEEGDDEPETDEPAESVGKETEPDADSHLPTLSSLAGIGIADCRDITTSPDSEETQVFDSKGYGE